jgi:HD-GYP domain-containing protein (c-di-GMP phosphodiesterase class II)
VRLVALSRCNEGTELAKSIYDSNGIVLLAEGYKLTDKVMSRLRHHGIFAVYVKDKYSDGLIEDTGISHELRQKSLVEIKASFTSLKSNNILTGRISPIILNSFQNICDDVLSELISNKKALSLMTNVQVFDNYLYNHSFNVMVYSLQLAINSGVRPKDLHELGISGLLHDVGKMVIPLEILNKPAKLTEEEFQLIKTHASEGYEYLKKQHELPLLAAHCAFQHHEKIDGTGYPRGLKGKDIHSFAKIMAVADVFDAVTSSRSYRKAMLPHKGFEILYAGSGTHFETELVQNFKKSVIMYPVGITVTLNTGETGFVVKNNDSFPERPIIRVIEKDGIALQDSEVHDIDMLTNLTADIVHSDVIM